MENSYIHENSELRHFHIDQTVLIKKQFISSISPMGYAQQIKAPPRSLDGYTACNSYYLYLEDSDAHERATNLFPSTSHSSQSVYADEELDSYAYSQRAAQQAYLSQRPVSFIILGKPGVGQKELGRRLADYWNCVYIHPESLIEEEIASGSRTGQCIEFNLRCGRAIGVDIILKLVEKRVRSRTAEHCGFVICGFPLVANDLYEEDPVSSESAVFNVTEIFEDIFAQTVDIGVPPAEVKVQVSKTSNFIDDEDVAGEEVPEEAFLQPNKTRSVEVMQEPIDVGSATEKVCVHPDVSLNYEEQINLLFSLLSQPFVTIYVTCSNADVTSIRNSHRYDITTNEIVNLRSNQNEDMVYTMFTKSDSDIPEQFSEVVPDSQPVDLRNLEHFVHLPRDFTACISAQLENYRFGALPHMERHILMNDPRYFLKLDGRIPPVRLMHSVKMKLLYLPLQRVLIPKKFNLSQEVVGGEGEHAEIINTDGMSAEEFFLMFQNKDVVHKMFRYSLSDWGYQCPVSMKNGTYLRGDPKFAVHFMDRIFFLSNEDALKKFTRNPRLYLSSPYPKPSCKIIVMGPEYSGKTAVSKCLAFLLDAIVIDPRKIRKSFLNERNNKYIEKCRSDAITEIMAKYELQHKISGNIRKREMAQTVIDWKKTVLDLLNNYIAAVQGYAQNVPEKTSKNLRESRKMTKGSEEDVVMMKETLIKMGLPYFEDIGEYQNLVDLPEELDLYLPKDLKYEHIEYTPPSVFHPEIIEYAEAAVSKLHFDNAELSNEDQLLMYKSAIKDAEDKNEAKGSNRGGWIIDGFPADKNLITELGVNFADDVFLLTDTSDDSSFLEQRLRNKGTNQYNNFRELFLSLGIIDAAFRAPSKSTETVRERMCRNIINDVLDTIPTSLSSESDPSEADTEYLERLAEEEYFQKNPRRSVIEHFKKSVNTYMEDVEEFLPELKKNNVIITTIDIKNKSSKEVLVECIRNIQDRYAESASYFTPEERVQEVQDFGETREDFLGGEEEGEAEEKIMEEDTFFERRRFGDTFNYCPVTFHDHWVLWRGKEEYAAKFQRKLYFMCNEEALHKFVAGPKDYLLMSKPPDAFPPPRICVLGPGGCGKSLVGKALARNLGLYYADFESLLVNSMPGKKYYQDKLEDIAKTSDVIKNYLINGDALPDEILDGILLNFWFKEPKKSTGFVLDGFPRRPTDVDYMIGNNTIPDIILEITCAHDIVQERLVKKLIDSWRRERTEEETLNRQEYNELLYKWESERANTFRDLMDRKRQERYGASLKGKGDGKEKGLEDLREEDDEVEVSATMPVRSEISIQSVVEDADALEINKFLDSVMPEPQYHEEYETEEQATERIVNAVQDTFIRDMTFLKLVREYADGEQIPWVQIDGNLIVDKVFSQGMRHCDKIKFRNNSLFERCYDVPVELAENLLNQGYFFLSVFGRMCPVQYCKRKNPIQLYLPMKEQSKLFPLIHRNQIYFLSDKKSRDEFKKDPLKYINYPRPIKPFLIPFRVAVIGPSLSGKTTLCKRFERDFGLKYISGGVAIRYVLQYLSNTALAFQVESALRKGYELTPEMVCNCVFAATLDGRSGTQGCIFDGIPSRRQCVRYFAATGILPHLMIDLQASHEDIFKFLSQARLSSTGPTYSHSLENHRYEEWLKDAGEFRNWLDKEYQNLAKISVHPSKWGVWIASSELATAVAWEIKQYYKNVYYDIVLRLANMQVSPLEFIERRGAFKHYCPGCLHYFNKLKAGGEQPDRTGLVQYKNYYYWLCHEHLEEFVDNPEQLLHPYIKHSLPEELPVVLTSLEEIPENIKEDGYCLVCYEENKPERIFSKGLIDYAVQFKNCVYLFDTADCMQQFLLQPQTYVGTTILFKKEPSVDCKSIDLPVLGFLEQYEAQAIIKAITNCSILRPLVPGLCPAASAAVCIGLYLKIHNPKTPTHLIDRYIDAQNKLHDRHLRIIDLLTGFKSTINPYLYYDDPIPGFADPEGLYSKLPEVIANEAQGEENKHPSVTLIIEEVLDTIKY